MDSLGTNEVLMIGQQLDSANGAVRLALQTDSNLVLYRNDTGEAMWASNTVNSGATKLVMQGDGNLVLYRNDGHAAWAANPAHHNGRTFVLQGDGNAVVFGPGGERPWATNTGPNRPHLVDAAYPWNGLPGPAHEDGWHTLDYGDGINIIAASPHPRPMEAPVNDTPMQITLSVRPTITWWKQVEVRNWHDEVIARITTENSTLGAATACRPMRDFSSGRLILSKKKFLGIETAVYEIHLPAVFPPIPWVEPPVPQGGGPLPPTSYLLSVTWTVEGG